MLQDHIFKIARVAMGLLDIVWFVYPHRYYSVMNIILIHLRSSNRLSAFANILVVCSVIQINSSCHGCMH